MKVVVHVETAKYKYVLTKCYLFDWTEEISSVKDVKDTVAWICVIEELNGNTITETFYEQESQKTIQDKFWGKTVLKTKGINYVSKWKVYIYMIQDKSCLRRKYIIPSGYLYWLKFSSFLLIFFSRSTSMKVMSKYFLDRIRSDDVEVNVGIDLLNYT